jgi:hypothetical protein
MLTAPVCSLLYYSFRYVTVVNHVNCAGNTIAGGEEVLTVIALCSIWDTVSLLESW